MKDYLLKLLQNCSEENFGQEAVEWAIIQGHVTLTYDLQTDLKTIMGDDPHGGPCGTHYDRIIVAYRQQCQQHGDALVDLYHASGLLEEILRPMPPMPLLPPLPNRQSEIANRQ